MKPIQNERKIFQLLASLKDAGKSYPPELYRARRDAFIKQVASTAVLTHAGLGGSQSLRTFTLPPSIGNLLEAVLVVAIVVEVGATAYLYRDKLSELINTVSPPRVEQVTNPLDFSSSTLAIIPNTGDRIVTQTLVSTPTVMPSPSLTATTIPAPSITLSIAPQNNDASGGDVQPNSTPVPGGNPDLNPRQTPKPQRTLPADDKKPTEENRPPKDG